MPNVQPPVKSGMITLQNFVKGFAPLADVYSADKHNFGNKDQFSFYTAGINPYRFPNTIAPAAQRTTNETGTAKITDTPRNIVTRTNGEAYMLGSGDGSTGGSVKLYKVTGVTYSAITDNSPSTPTFPHVVATAKNGYDLKIVTLSGTDYLIYTWDAGTAATRHIGIWDFSTNWTSSNLADDAWAALSSGGGNISQLAIEQGGDNNYYITAGTMLDKLIAVNTPSSAFSAAALSLPTSYVALSIRDYKGNMAVAASPKQALGDSYPTSGATYSINGLSKVFFWDYVNSTFVDIINVNDNYISDLEVKDGILYAFSGKRDGYSKLKEFTGQEFETVAGFVGAPPWHNNPDIYRNLFIWTANSQVMSYGRPDQNFPKAFNVIDNGGVSGFAKVLYAVANYDYHISGSTKWARVLGTGSDSGGSTYGGTFISLPHKSTIYAVKFYFNLLATGAYAICEYIANKGGTNTVFSKDSGVIDFSVDGAITEKTFSQNIPDVDDFLIYISFPNGSTTNCVAVTRVEIFYQQTNKL